MYLYGDDIATAAGDLWETFKGNWYYFIPFVGPGIYLVKDNFEAWAADNQDQFNQLQQSLNNLSSNVSSGIDATGSLITALPYFIAAGGVLLVMYLVSRNT